MTSVRRAAPHIVVCALPLLVAAAAPGCGQMTSPTSRPRLSAGARPTTGRTHAPDQAFQGGRRLHHLRRQHHLRSRVHNADVAGKDISLVGYIVKTNLADAPACAVHKTGKGDKDDCKAAVPAFWIADEKGDDKNAIKVMGWASNFAQIYDAVEKYSVKTNTEAVKDEFWAVDIPNPIPNKAPRSRSPATTVSRSPRRPAASRPTRGTAF